MPTAAQMMSTAKANLVLEQAFFASIICSMPMIEDRNLPMKTMATNGKYVKYDPDWVLTLTPDEVKFVLCHEVGHVIFQHMFRRGSRDHVRWNQAGDYIINDMLSTAKVNRKDGSASMLGSMPKGGLLNAALVKAGGGTTDGVYDLLPEGQDDGNGGTSNGHGAPMDTCEDLEGTEAEKQEAEAEMKVALAQAAQAAKMQGHLTASIERLIEGAMRPRVDWKDVLRRFMSARAKVERSWARPNRRFLGEGIYMPTLGGQSMGEIAIGIDVSGSIDAKQLSAFFAEIKGIKADMNPAAVHNIYFHSNVAHYDRFEQDAELELWKDPISGGTAFSPIFRFIEGQDIEPACAVILTDLECSDFGPPPAYPVLWVSTQPGKAPWGEVVVMDPAL